MFLCFLPAWTRAHGPRNVHWHCDEWMTWSHTIQDWWLYALYVQKCMLPAAGTIFGILSHFPISIYIQLAGTVSQHYQSVQSTLVSSWRMFNLVLFDYLLDFHNASAILDWTLPCLLLCTRIALWGRWTQFFNPLYSLKVDSIMAIILHLVIRELRCACPRPLYSCMRKVHA